MIRSVGTRQYITAVIKSHLEFVMMLQLLEGVLEQCETIIDNLSFNRHEWTKRESTNTS